MGEIRNRKKKFDTVLNVKLSRYQLEYIKKRAKEENISVSKWIRNLIFESSRWTKI